MHQKQFVADTIKSVLPIRISSQDTDTGASIAESSTSSSPSDEKDSEIAQLQREVGILREIVRNLEQRVRLMEVQGFRNSTQVVNERL